VWESADLLQARLVQAIATGDGVEFDYDGGNEPGQRRRVSPGLLFTVDGYPGTYLAGYCHERQAERTFLVDRLRLR
jgi:predicted DNA-binding transcriptional regulator YafY